VTSTERLIEAVTYAQENNIDWWEIFGTPSNAMKVLKISQRSNPDEEQIICLLSALDSEDLFGSCTVHIAYEDALSNMEQELQEILD